MLTWFPSSPKNQLNFSHKCAQNLVPNSVEFLIILRRNIMKYNSIPFIPTSISSSFSTASRALAEQGSITSAWKFLFNSASQLGFWCTVEETAGGVAAGRDIGEDETGCKGGEQDTGADEVDDCGCGDMVNKSPKSETLVSKLVFSGSS